MSRLSVRCNSPVQPLGPGLFLVGRFLTADSLRACPKVAATSRFSVSRLR